MISHSVGVMFCPVFRISSGTAILAEVMQVAGPGARNDVVFVEFEMAAHPIAEAI